MIWDGPTHITGIGRLSAGAVEHVSTPSSRVAQACSHGGRVPREGVETYEGS